MGYFSYEREMYFLELYIEIRYEKSSLIRAGCHGVKTTAQFKLNILCIKLQTRRGATLHTSIIE